MQLCQKVWQSRNEEHANLIIQHNHDVLVEPNLWAALLLAATRYKQTNRTQWFNGCDKRHHGSSIELELRNGVRLFFGAVRSEFSNLAQDRRYSAPSALTRILSADANVLVGSSKETSFVLSGIQTPKVAILIGGVPAITGVLLTQIRNNMAERRVRGSTPVAAWTPRSGRSK